MTYDTKIEKVDDRWWFSIRFNDAGTYYGLHFETEDAAKDYKENFTVLILKNKPTTVEDTMKCFCSSQQRIVY